MSSARLDDDYVDQGIRERERERERDISRNLVLIVGGATHVDCLEYE